MDTNTDAPDWVRWMAYDEDGSLWGYEQRPILDGGDGWSVSSGGVEMLRDPTAPGRYRPDWRLTLVEVKRAEVAPETEHTPEQMRQDLERDLKDTATRLLQFIGAQAVTLPLEAGGEIRAGRAALDYRDATITGLRAQVANQGATIASKELTITKLRADLESRDGTIAELCVERAALSGKVVELQSRNDRQRETIRQYMLKDVVSEDCSAMRAERNHARDLARDRQDEIARLRGLLRHKDVTNDGLCRERLALDAQVQSIQEQLRQRTAERDAANAKLEQRAAVPLHEAVNMALCQQRDDFAEILQKAATAAGLLPGDDITVKLVPKIEQLLSIIKRTREYHANQTDTIGRYQAADEKLRELLGLDTGEAGCDPDMREVVEKVKSLPVSKFTAQADAAVRTLTSLGYSYSPGAELWKPPVGGPGLDYERLVDIFKGGAEARDTGKHCSHLGNTEHLVHSWGWVQRDLRLALDGCLARASSAESALASLGIIRATQCGEPCERAGMPVPPDGC